MATPTRARRARAAKRVVNALAASAHSAPQAHTRASQPRLHARSARLDSPPTLPAPVLLAAGDAMLERLLRRVLRPARHVLRIGTALRVRARAPPARPTACLVGRRPPAHASLATDSLALVPVFRARSARLVRSATLAAYAPRAPPAASAPPRRRRRAHSVLMVAPNLWLVRHPATCATLVSLALLAPPAAPIVLLVLLAVLVLAPAPTVVLVPGVGR
jgi:hypothetical protein